MGVNGYEHAFKECASRLRILLIEASDEGRPFILLKPVEEHTVSDSLVYGSILPQSMLRRALLADKSQKNASASLHCRRGRDPNSRNDARMLMVLHSSKDIWDEMTRTDG